MPLRERNPVIGGTTQSFEMDWLKPSKVNTTEILKTFLSLLSLKMNSYIVTDKAKAHPKQPLQSTVHREEQGYSNLSNQSLSHYQPTH